MNQKNYRNAGRHPKLDPTVYRCSVNFNAVEQSQLQAMHEKSGVESLSAFIKLQLFGKPFKVFYVDENSRIFIDRLSDFNAMYRTIGITYDRAVKELEGHNTSSRSSAMLRELVKIGRAHV